MNKISFFIFISFFLFSFAGYSQANDSGIGNANIIRAVPLQIDSLLIKKDSVTSIKTKKTLFNNQLEKLLSENRFINSDRKGVSPFVTERDPKSSDMNFYLLLFVFLFLGILKILFSKYFTNLIKVFFNSSLRQSQLTDQLLQEKLPSLFFNFFFVVVGGIYIFYLLVSFEIYTYNRYDIMLYCMLIVMIVYLTKFLILEILGWITGYKRDVKNYIFVVFLINKILAICLLPLIVVVTFASQPIRDGALVISYFVIGLMFILRYLRGFSVMHQTLKVSKFHFFLYIIALELMPIFLIYRLVLTILDKSL